MDSFDALVDAAVEAGLGLPEQEWYGQHRSRAAVLLALVEAGVTVTRLTDESPDGGRFLGRLYQARCWPRGGVAYDNPDPVVAALRAYLASKEGDRD